jgi:isopenicillin-N epimerase
LPHAKRAARAGEREINAPRFGRALRPLWHLEPGGTFLNHGSYGACPREVLAVQDRLRLEMEAQPDRFFRDRIMPGEGETALRAAAGQLARFVGCSADSLAFVENATAGAQAVVDAMPLQLGDEILVTDHTYNAVRLIVEARCAKTGATARVVKLPLHASAKDMVARFAAAVTPNVRLAIVDHITSPTALCFPMGEVIAALKMQGARVLVDGAHAVGHVPLALDALGVDWYVSNAHKWLYAPRGTAFLYAAAEVKAMTQPLVVSHFVGQGFPRSFDYVATRDYTAWLSVPAAIRFHAGFDAVAVEKHRAAILAAAKARLESLGARAVGADDMRCGMRAFALPQSRAAAPADAQALMRELWERARVQVACMVFGGELLLRVSGQVYVEEADVEVLGEALARLGWPGR